MVLDGLDKAPLIWNLEGDKKISLSRQLESGEIPLDFRWEINGRGGYLLTVVQKYNPELGRFETVELKLHKFTI